MCQNELLVILGAEASLLVFPAAMTVYAKRMDVLSGRSFERSVVSPTNDRHPLRPFRRESRDLLLLIRRLIDLAISRDGPTLPERRGRAFRQTAVPPRVVRRTLRPAAARRGCFPAAQQQRLIVTLAPTDRAPGPNSGSRALLSSREESALLECALRLIVQRLEQIG